MPAKIPVTVLGATGVVGQRFVRRLARHPRFRIAHLAASERSAGRRFRDACTWRLDGEEWAGLGDQVLVAADPDVARAPVVFSALDAESARTLEPRFAAAGALVFSNASAFRMEADVPLLVPEVNPSHLELLETQRRRGWKGGIVTNPNCTAAILAVALAPLDAAFGIEALIMTSMQAVSGAGYPGVPSLDVMGNVIPFIAGEEAKVEQEIPKIFGEVIGGAVAPAPFPVSALCHRVPVVEGHLEAVSVRLTGLPSPSAAAEVLASFRPEAAALELPSLATRPVILHEAADRPQPRLDVERDGGMPVQVGRIRPCPLLGLKFSLLGHNTERGAAGASVANAELAIARGLVT